jgi:hypothetical protein
MKNLVKAMDKNGAGLMYLKHTFSMLSDAKAKEGIFVDEQFEEQLNEVGKSA